MPPNSGTYHCGAVLSTQNSIHPEPEVAVAKRRVEAGAGVDTSQLVLVAPGAAPRNVMQPSVQAAGEGDPAAYENHP